MSPCILRGSVFFIKNFFLFLERSMTAGKSPAVVWRITGCMAGKN